MRRGPGHARGFGRGAPQLVDPSARRCARARRRRLASGRKSSTPSHCRGDEPNGPPGRSHRHLAGKQHPSVPGLDRGAGSAETRAPRHARALPTSFHRECGPFSPIHRRRRFQQPGPPRSGRRGSDTAARQRDVRARGEPGRATKAVVGVATRVAVCRRKAVAMRSHGRHRRHGRHADARQPARRRPDRGRAMAWPAVWRHCASRSVRVPCSG